LDELIEKLQSFSSHPNQNFAPEIAPVLGISSTMRKITETLPRLAKLASRILITGESGVGKEVIAREIHRLNPKRAEQPFVAINCGALPENLLEAELFGFEKGAFTGAFRSKKGLFEQAHKGTLFLDEIGDMPKAMQVKLLRALQEQRVTPIGGEKEIPVDIHLICATHQDLKAMVEKGTFREDLFYRIHLIHLRIPPLRERKEDILWLAQRFFQEYASQAGACRKPITDEIERLLLSHHWPGNVRELRNAIERACILSEGDELEPHNLFDQSTQQTQSVLCESNDLSGFLHTCERSFILQAVTRHNGQMGQTAQHLGISRKNLWEKMKKLGISANVVEDLE